MTYKIWDKVSPIYDVTAEQAMINNPLFASEDSYVFYRDNGAIYDIVPISLLPEGNTIAERCDRYIEALTAAPKNVSKQESEIKLLKAQVEALTEQNEMLEECLVELAQAVYA